MPLAATGRNNVLGALGATHCSAHTDIPNASGSNEATGGSPAYARKAISFSAASGGTRDKDATDPVIDVPAGTYIAIGLWDAVSGGNFLGWGPINGGDLDGVGAMNASTDLIASRAHGLVNGERVVLFPVAGESLLGGLSDSIVYFVVAAVTDNFSVSLTNGGAAVDATVSSDLAFQRVIPTVLASQGTLTVDTLTIDGNFA